VANTTVLDRQRPAGLREALRSSHESVHATILIEDYPGKDRGDAQIIEDAE